MFNWFCTRRKIVKILVEQPTPAEEKPADAPAEETPAPDAAAPPAPGAPATPAPDAAAETPAPDAGAAPAATPPPAADASATPPPAEEKPTADAEAEKQVSPETKEALDVDRFVQYLKKQEGNIAKLKSIIKVVNLSLDKAEVEDQANQKFWN